MDKEREKDGVLRVECGIKKRCSSDEWQELNELLEAKENKTHKRLKVQTQARFYKTKNMRGFQRIKSFSR